ncbi:MAG TPA: BMP family ABC transporter substrate-binding protein [Niallia sp.]|nr:BMP family ABC transporter substrate-binding protein [Niallia sp.]
MKVIFTNRNEKQVGGKDITLLFLFFLICFFLFCLSSCGKVEEKGEITKVGLLVEGKVTDQGWGTQAYKGLLNIQDRYHCDIYYKEYIDSYTVAKRAVEEYQNKGVNLIFGHGDHFVEYFNDLGDEFPSIHFVSVNGTEQAIKENTTNLHLENYSMGFFAGMVAGHITETNSVGIIAVNSGQEEVKGFEDGAKYVNNNITVIKRFVGNSEDNREKALSLWNQEMEQNIDIVYPAGDSFHVDIVEAMKAEGLYSIGYITNQQFLGKDTVLTSTVQDIPKLYMQIAERFDEGKLIKGNETFGMEDDITLLGPCSPKVDKEFISELNKAIDYYKKTNKLPNQR